MRHYRRVTTNLPNDDSNRKLSILLHSNQTAIENYLFWLCSLIATSMAGVLLISSCMSVIDR